MTQRRRTPATEYFGAELRRTREEAAMSREDLGKLAGYAAGTIAQLEIGERFPQDKFVAWLDDHFQTDRFRLIYDRLLRRDAYPESFRPWIDIEREATVLRSYELAVIPGLLQTAQYARALLRSAGNDVEAMVSARMERQAILERERPPSLIALISETGLRQTVGGEDVMRQQLHKVADAADRWIIQVVPLAAETYIHLAGSFAIATIDGSDVVYTPTQLSGYVVDSTELVADAMWRWEAIRSEALPRGQSRDLIVELASGYGQA
jgi:transcriptional regulator with XRE-family HTH domain